MDCENASYPFFDTSSTILPSHVPSFHAFIITDPQVAEFLPLPFNSLTWLCFQNKILLTISDQPVNFLFLFSR
jgi:hypothetical protein